MGKRFFTNLDASKETSLLDRLMVVIRSLKAAVKLQKLKRKKKTLHIFH